MKSIFHYSQFFMAGDQEQIFEKILELAIKGKLVLWAGAGLSREAGYPSGWELTKILWDKLSEDEKKEVPEDLIKVSDHYVNRAKNGREDLILILKEIFKIKPQKSKSHEIINKMAFFKSIITTNYDELFEDYIPGIHVIKSTKDLSRSNSNSRRLIKIHGDLKSPKRLVLTQADYAKLYERDNRNPFWSKLRVELTEKGVLFIGYGFNDQNVEGLFTYLAKKLKNRHLPKFLVAPDLTMAHQLKLEKLGVNYLNNAGEIFLGELYNSFWKTKGYKYFGLPEVSMDSLFYSLSAEGLPIKISSKSEGGRMIQFNPEPGKVWDLTFSTKDKELEKRIIEWNKGYGSDYLNISQKSIGKANLKIGDFVVGDKNTLPEFQFERIGTRYNKVRVVLENRDIELEDLVVRVLHYGEEGARLLATNRVASFEIKIPRYSTKGFSYSCKFTPNEPCDSIAGVLKWHEVIYSFGNGEPFKVFSPELPKGYRFENGGKSQNLEELQRNTLIFQVLRMIEEKFTVRFSDFGQNEIYNDNTLRKLQIFLDLFRTNRLNKDISNGFPIIGISSNPEIDVVSLVERAKEDGYLIVLQEAHRVSLLGQDIDLGKSQTFFENPYLDESESEPGNILLKSRTNNCFAFYEAFGLAVFNDRTDSKNIEDKHS